MRKTSGIYCIECLINNKKYIGKAKNIRHRWNYHKNFLRKGRHDNSYLQRAWNKYSEQNFRFLILEEVLTESERTIKEQYYADKYETFNREYGYNIGECLNNPCSGIKLSYYRRKKMSKLAKENLTEETKNRLKTMNIGRKHTKEALQNMSKAQKGHKVSKETRRKVAVGQKIVQENRSTSEKRKIFAHRMETVYFISPNNEIYKVVGLRQFCIEFKLDRAALFRIWQEKPGCISHKGWKKGYETKDMIIKDYRQ